MLAGRNAVVPLPLQGSMAQCRLPAVMLSLPSELYRGSGRVAEPKFLKGFGFEGGEKHSNQLPTLPSLPSTEWGSTWLFNSAAPEMWFRAWLCAADPAWRRWQCLLSLGQRGGLRTKALRHVLKCGTADVDCAGMSHSCTATPALTANRTTSSLLQWVTAYGQPNLM